MVNDKSKLRDPIFLKGYSSFRNGAQLSDDPYVAYNEEWSKLWQSGWKYAIENKIDLPNPFAESLTDKVVEKGSESHSNSKSDRFEITIGLIKALLVLAGLFVLGVIATAVVKWAFRIVF